MFGAGSHLWRLDEINAPLAVLVHCAMNNGLLGSNRIDMVSLRRSSIKGVTSRRDCENAMYLLSVVDRVISVCNLEVQMIGQLA